MLKPEVGKESRKAKLPKTAVATGSLAMALVSLVGLGLIKKRKQLILKASFKLAFLL